MAVPDLFAWTSIRSMAGYTMTSHCPACGEIAVPPINRGSPVLIIGDVPSESDMERGLPFMGPAGGILRSELAEMGIDISDIDFVNLWLHPPLDDKGLNKDERERVRAQNEQCKQAGRDVVLDVAKNRKSILLVGADVVSEFTTYQVSKVSGLSVDSAFLSCKNIYAMVNPSIVFHNVVGEVRLALQKWSRFLKKSKIIK